MMKLAIDSKIKKSLPASWLNKTFSDTDLMFQFCFPNILYLWFFLIDFIICFERRAGTYVHEQPILVQITTYVLRGCLLLEQL